MTKRLFLAVCWLTRLVFAVSGWVVVYDARNDGSIFGWWVLAGMTSILTFELVYQVVVSKLKFFDVLLVLLLLVLLALLVVVACSANGSTSLSVTCLWIGLLLCLATYNLVLDMLRGYK